ncbi:MAG: cell envelope integrity protein TolA [Gammaproteobacteria bacterium]
MWQAVRENPRAVAYALLMHLGLLLLLVFSLDWTPKSIKPGSNKPIQAELVDASKLQAIEEKKLAEQRKVEEDKRKAEEAVKQKAEAERRQQLQQEQARKAEVERKKKAAQDAKKKTEADRKKKADLAAQQQAEEKRKAAAATKQKAEAERKRKAAEEAKKKAAAEKQRKAEQAVKEKAVAEAAARREAEQSLQAQLAEEQAQARAENALSQYIPYIQQKIQRNWLRPAGSPAGLSCLILVKLIPGGEVVDAKVVRSSGDPLFDRSVETAVLKASPLPMPDDATMFKYFREINFNFKPDT